MHFFAGGNGGWGYNAVKMVTFYRLPESTDTASTSPKIVMHR